MEIYLHSLLHLHGSALATETGLNYQITWIGQKIRLQFIYSGFIVSKSKKDSSD
jgi:ABC-type glucose/galactose transport system permease subunit